MDFEYWEPFYEKILEDFGFSREADESAAGVLGRLLHGTRIPPSSLDSVIRGQRVTVAGNAARLAQDLAGVDGVVIAADEATSVLVAAGKRPDVIVTDLDGTIEDQVTANREGAIAVVHAHGDNVPAIERWAVRFEGLTMATTQARPFGDVHNFGGFTDGDRGVLLAAHFGARSIRLAGFDFETPNAKDQPAAVKRRKLDWAYILIHSVAAELLED